jgi:MFS family permease
MYPSSTQYQSIAHASPQSYGVFLSHYLTTNTFPNTSPLAYAFIGGLSISQAVLIAPLATRVVHSYGTRTCLHVGVFFETLSLIGASFADQKYQIILSQGICFGWGMGFLFVGSVGIIAQWFTTKRSLANAIAAAGSGFGGLTYSLATQHMIDTLGLPWAFRILGIVSCLVNLVSSNLLRDRNKAVGARHKAFDIQLLARPEFVLLQGWSIFSMLGYTALLFSLPNYAASVGLSANQGSIIGALMNLGQMLGRPIMGLISDRYGRINIATSLTILCSLFCFAFWIPAKGMGLLSFFAVVGGALSGTFWATIAPVGAEIVGLPDLPAALSITWVVMVPPTTVAEAIALELRREGTSNVYVDAQIFVAMMYLGGALCLWIVRGWKVGQLEEVQRQLGSRGVDEAGVREAEKKIQEGVPIPQPSSVDKLRKSGWRWKDLARRMWAKKIV